MLVKFTLVCACTTLLSLNIFASTTLCTLTSDMDNSTAKLTYDLDADGRGIEHLYQETNTNGQDNKVEINMDGINNGGIVLLKSGNNVVVRIWSDNFDKDQGGMLYLDTLYNGVNGQRKQYDLELNHGSLGFDLSYNKVAFDQMKFIAKRSKILGVIGIDSIQFSN